MAYKETEAFKSKSVEWETPDSIFVPLDEEFGFTLDVCASAENNKCKDYFTIEDDGLMQNWEGICWMNPPFGRYLKEWVKKAYLESNHGCTIVALLPVRSNTNYWHDFILGKAEVRFIRGNPKFGDSKRGLTMPLAIVVWHG